MTMPFSARLLLVLGLLATGCASSSPSDQDVEGPAPLVITVSATALHAVDHRLFGQFLERPSWSGDENETGPERAFDPQTGGLDPRVQALVYEMAIPVVRWPGGTDIDHMDWTDMIDNAPGRDRPERPVSVGHRGDSVTNRFGMDEGLGAIEAAGAETILVVNLLDGVNGTRSVEDAALHAAGLVAYAAAPVGAALPEGMPDWPALRAQNGRAEPWAVRYVQIGNEWHAWEGDDGEPLYPRTGPVDPADKERLFEALDRTIAAVHAVLPEAEIIIDGMVDDVTGEVRERLGRRVDYLAVHHYHPWGLRRVALGEGEQERELDLNSFVQNPKNAEAAWTAWTAPREVDALGLAVLPAHDHDQAVAQGYPVAVTEWNWNGWWVAPDADPAVGTLYAKGIGAASYLFEMMRRGDEIALATQSLLVGWHWDIAGIAVPGEGAPHRRPTAQVTAFLSAHHGAELLALQHTAIPTVAQPYAVGGGIFPKPAVALVEPLATRSADSLYVHLLNRSFATPQPVRLDLSAYAGLGGAVHHRLVGSTRGEPGQGRDPREQAWTESSPVQVDGAALLLTLPPASLSTVAIALPKAGR